jgi:hypothetical protein
MVWRFTCWRRLLRDLRPRLGVVVGRPVDTGRGGVGVWEWPLHCEAWSPADAAGERVKGQPAVLVLAARSATGPSVRGVARTSPWCSAPLDDLKSKSHQCAQMYRTLMNWGKSPGENFRFTSWYWKNSCYLVHQFWENLIYTLPCVEDFKHIKKYQRIGLLTQKNIILE